jgi:exopolysaccharide production protein ExoQ
MLLLNQWSIISGSSVLPVIDILLFIGPWAWILLRQPNKAIGSLVSNWLLMAMPVLALTSTIWSDYPAWTSRAALQYLITTIIGILAGSCIKPRALLSALLCAVSLVAFWSVMHAGTTGAGFGGFGVYAMLGLFASKNYFAMTIAILLLTGLAVALDRSQPWPFRVLGLIGVLAAPFLLKFAQSTGAMVVSFVAVLTTLAIYFGSRLLPQFRVALIGLVTLLLIMFTVLASFNLDEFSEVLNLFGKDLTLTGRIFLWEHALMSFSENPILGVGYQAYWQLGSPGAEELWAYAKMGKYGYHFHNTYLQVAVDLGSTALIILVATFLGLGIRTISTALMPRPKPEALFAIAAFLLLLLRTPLEVDLFFQFQMPTILLCLSWIYLQRSSSTQYVVTRNRSRH